MTTESMQNVMVVLREPILCQRLKMPLYCILFLLLFQVLQ